MAFQGDSIFWVEVNKVVPNPFQPRREFDESKLKELSESVRMYGILQPLTVTRREISREDGTFYTEYELIAGERRLRASQLAGLEQVPVIIREGEQSEQEKLELAIIENLQREDLNGVDRALAFKQLADNFGLSHAQVAKKVGRSREYVSNTIRLLLLPDYMLESLKVGDITEGHARTLLMLNDRQEEQDTLYREILLKKLSVREVERIARKIANDKVRKKKWKNTDPALIEKEKMFTEALGTRVQIAKTDYGGKISIDYFSDEDLVAILERLKKENARAVAVSASAIAAVTDELEDSSEDEREMLEKMNQAVPLESPVDVVSQKNNADEPSERSDMSTQEETDNTEDKSEAHAHVPKGSGEISSLPSQPDTTAPSEVSKTDEVTTKAMPVAQNVQTEKPRQVPSQFTGSNPLTEKVSEHEDDESNLYGIKNFGI